MAIDIGLKAAEKKRYLELLLTSHAIEVTVQLMDLSHNYLADISHLMLSGQVDIDASATESTRTCTMELLDPKKALALDGNSPTDGSMYYTRQIKVIYSVVSVDRTERFSIPLFCGPLSKVDRNGVVLTINAVGKEKLSSGSVWTTKTFKKNAQKSSVIKSLMVDFGGEHPSKVLVKDYATVAAASRRLPADLVVSALKESTPWTTAKRIASGMNRRFYYDGRGNAIMKKRTSTVQFSFTENGALLSQPNASFDAESVINSVLVMGGVVGTGKNKRRISYRAVPPRGHVLSPWSMGRWGKPRYLTEVVSDDTIKSTKEARLKGQSILNQKLREQVDVSFEALPIPHLEEGDLCSVVSDNYTGQFYLTKMSIPLTANGRSTIGYLKRVSPVRRKLGNLTRRRTTRTSA